MNPTCPACGEQERTGENQPGWQTKNSDFRNNRRSAGPETGDRFVQRFEGIVMIEPAEPREPRYDAIRGIGNNAQGEPRRAA
jgi:hypothetical protein